MSSDESERFSKHGTHISDAENKDWFPQAGTHIAAEMIVEKLNELHSKKEKSNDNPNEQ